MMNIGITKNFFSFLRNYLSFRIKFSPLAFLPIIYYPYNILI
ncbi:MAG TPA: hypothetical protein DHV15_01805 [Treponema sp.]|uniref:Uncharacterized protein n=1 Tax=Treponema denticola (strain ATCC 35405 / DSM 14222 / CIP 103919 / JCM 8153 / KCTC 15104) TaxID=243275 RepID=Q73JS9_TREDE|nr:hypothetical protein TDE_2481 [Treponema denticola ATCC 35405]HCY94238.1 hypothetical protein [Treponema sp.]